MSLTNSGLASLTANYTDSEDEDHTPEPLLHSVNEDSQDEQELKPPRSIDSVGSGTGNTLVSYNLDPDQIDDDDVDDISVEPGHISSNGSNDCEIGNERPRSSPNPNAVDSIVLTTDARKKEDSLEMEPVSPAEDDKQWDIKASPWKAVKLPPEPPGKCSSKLTEKFAKMYQGKRAGKLNMNEHIQTKKMFRNPSIYEKLILHLEIDEFGTNYPEHMFNPHEWSESSFYDELAKVQKAEMERREKERRDRTKVEFVSGTAKKTMVGATVSLPVNSTAASSASGSGHSDGEMKRKSKWDQRGVMPPLLMTVGNSSQSHVVIPPSIVNSVNAAVKAKPVSINAFGSLQKKK